MEKKIRGRLHTRLKKKKKKKGRDLGFVCEKLELVASCSRRRKKKKNLLIVKEGVGNLGKRGKKIPKRAVIGPGSTMRPTLRGGKLRGEGCHISGRLKHRKKTSLPTNGGGCPTLEVGSPALRNGGKVY